MKRVLITLLLAYLMGLPTVVGAAEEAWKSAGFNALSESPMNWDQAKNFCQQHDGRLPLVGGGERLGGIRPTRGTPIDGFGAEDAPWPNGLPFDRYLTGTVHSSDPNNSWYVSSDNASTVSAGASGGKVTAGTTLQGYTRRVVCVPRGMPVATAAPVAAETKDYTDATDIRGLTGGAISYPDTPRHFSEKDPQRTPFSGTVKKWWRNKEGERLEYEAVLKGGYVISQTNYYDDPTAVIESEQVLDQVAGYRTVKTYHRNGKLKTEERYATPKGHNGYIKDGLFKGYHDNGYLYEEQTFANNVAEGIKKVYNKDGKLTTETAYKGGKKHGLLKEYDPKTGTLTKEEPFVEDYLEGVRKDYRSDNGALRMTQEFKKGKPDGAKVTYDKDGKTATKTEMFKDGRPVS